VGGVPIVALHRILLASDHRAGNVMARGRVAAHETQAVGRDEMRLLGRNRRPFRIADQRTGVEGGLLAQPRRLDRIFDGQGPRVVEIEVGTVPGHQRRLGQAGAVVLGREAGDIERRFDRFTQRLRRKIGSAGVALALTRVDGDADTLVAVELDRFDLVATHRHRLAEAFRDIDLAGRRPFGVGMFEHILGELLQGGEGIGKSGGVGHGSGVWAGKSLS
jgi:hypothetical protein